MSSAKKQTLTPTATVSAEQIFTPKFEYRILPGQPDVTVDFSDVEYIDSENIRSMVMWLTDVSTLYPHVAIVFATVPSTAYSQLLMFGASLPAQLIVSSMAIPFFCDDCSEDFHKFYTAEQLLKSKNPMDALKPFPACPVCAKEMQADIDRENFFSLVSPRPIDRNP
jgi:hypothetical protein